MQIISTFNRSVAFAAFVAAFMATLAVALSVGERVPDGVYCGNYANGLVVGNISTKAGSDKFDVSMKGLGMDLQCKDETFNYDPKTHHAKVIGATDPKDCLGAVLTEGNLNLDVIYEPDNDVLILDLGIAKIPCKKCTTILV